MNARALAMCVVSFLVLAVTTLSGSTEAKQIGGQLTIAEGSFYGWRMDVAIPSTLEFNITSLSSDRMDVLVLDEQNYTLYSSNSAFSFYPAYSSINVTEAAANMTLLTGTLYVLIDNTDKPLNCSGACPVGSIQVQYWIGSSFEFGAVPDVGSDEIVWVFAGLAAAGLVTMLFFTRRILKNRNR